MQFLGANLYSFKFIFELQFAKLVLVLWIWISWENLHLIIHSLAKIALHFNYVTWKTCKCKFFCSIHHPHPDEVQSYVSGMQREFRSQSRMQYIIHARKTFFVFYRIIFQQSCLIFSTYLNVQSRQKLLMALCKIFFVIF